MGEGLIERLDKKKEADLFESTSSLFVSATGGTIDSDIPGTFESDTGGTLNPLLSAYYKSTAVI